MTTLGSVSSLSGPQRPSTDLTTDFDIHIRSALRPAPYKSLSRELISTALSDHTEPPLPPMEIRERLNDLSRNPSMLIKLCHWYQQLVWYANRKYGRGLNPLHTSGNDRSNKVLGNRSFLTITQAELQTFGGGSPHEQLQRLF